MTDKPVDLAKRRALKDFEEEMASVDRLANKIYIVSAMGNMMALKRSIQRVPDSLLAIQVLDKLDNWLHDQLKELNGGK